MLTRDRLRLLMNGCLLLVLASVSGCWLSHAENAEIGCGVDAQVSAKCPNRPDASVDAGTVDAALNGVDATSTQANESGAFSEGGTTD